MGNDTTKGQTTMKKLTANQYRNVYAGIRKLVVEKCGTFPERFDEAVKSTMCEDYRRTNVTDPNFWCKIAAEVATDIYGVPAKDVLECYNSPSDLNKTERSRWIFLSEVTSERAHTPAERKEFKELNRRMAL
jgi:hypothetical protein